MNEQRLDDPVAEEAIDWMVRLQSGDFDDHLYAELEHWRSRSSHHRQVYQRLLAGLAQFQQSPWRGRASQPLLRSLEQSDGRRTFLCTALGLSLLLGGAGWLASSPQDAWCDGREPSTFRGMIAGRRWRSSSRARRSTSCK
ncbi:FecR/PupR family sigma factor regulator [Pseudomonas sp. 5P_5.1_Bac1]|uniref:FecR/PupR family sigma factor regulator n=1 Tax=Pseudomonas sp. 5P_5.1_Bac1 TaxID=2971616 RepID=UPI0021C56F45|nr:DUF4880 domain-containing protein [Pseudomonas sp. 5P_5.1_Bac1]MCU1723127.1 DUF4880 domain-containing protein [Pseudomonas sp. 5P_5.1_Bac1]